LKIETTRIINANADLTAKLDAVAANWLECQPDKAALSISPDRRVYRARPRGFSKAIGNLCVQLVHSAIFRNNTNEQIVAHLQGLFPDYPVSKNILSKPLLDSHKSAIRIALRDHGWQVDFNKQNTPSKLKQTLKAIAAGREAPGTRVFKPKIVITNDTVVVNEREYSISSEGRIRKGGRWIAVQTLENLLSA